MDVDFRVWGRREETDEGREFVERKWRFQETKKINEVEKSCSKSSYVSNGEIRSVI